MSTSTVPFATCVVYGAGIGLPTMVTFQSISSVTVIAEGGTYTKDHVFVIVQDFSSIKF